MAYNSISIKHYIKSHLELQREITQIELAPSPNFFVLSICLAYINMFARFDENPAMTLQDIKETKRYGRTHGRPDGRTHPRTDNVKTAYPPQTKFARGIIIFSYTLLSGGLSYRLIQKDWEYSFCILRGNRSNF